MTVTIPAVVPEALAIRVYGFVREQHPFGFKVKFTQMGHVGKRFIVERYVVCHGMHRGDASR